MTNEQIAIDLCSVHHMTGDSGQLCPHCERIKAVLDERDADHRRSEAAFIELVNDKDAEIAKLLEAVKKMEEALAGVETICFSPGMEDPFKDGWKWFYRVQDALAFRSVKP